MLLFLRFEKVMWRKENSNESGSKRKLTLKTRKKAAALQVTMWGRNLQVQPHLGGRFVLRNRSGWSRLCGLGGCIVKWGSGCFVCWNISGVLFTFIRYPIMFQTKNTNSLKNCLNNMFGRSICPNYIIEIFNQFFFCRVPIKNHSESKRMFCHLVLEIPTFLSFCSSIFQSMKNRSRNLAIFRGNKSVKDIPCSKQSKKS